MQGRAQLKKKRVQKEILGAGEVAQLVSCVLSKHEDLSSSLGII